VLRSDVYRATDEHRLVAEVPAPLVTLSGSYKTVAGFDRRIPHTPSLRRATALTVEGDWTFGRDVVVEGAARLGDPGAPAHIPDGARVTEHGLA
jgi:UTP--glucose-1-phosphate uridylyltransferase